MKYYLPFNCCVYFYYTAHGSPNLFPITVKPRYKFISKDFKIVLNTKVLSIANIEVAMKTLLRTKIGMLYWRNHVKSGCAKAGFHCTPFTLDSLSTHSLLSLRINHSRFSLLCFV